MWQDWTPSKELQDGKLADAEGVQEWTIEYVGPIIPPRPRQFSPWEETELRKAISRWSDQGYIEPSRALAQCNPVLVLKTNGTYRTCIDYRPVNAACKDFEWPLPRIDTIRFWAAGRTRYSRIDLKDAFHRIHIRPEFRTATAFRTPWGCYQFTRMPFGLKTAPAVFQRFMDHMLHSLHDIAMWYQDDICVGTTPGQSHEAALARVRRRLSQSRVTTNDDKSEYDKPSIRYVGLLLTQQGVTGTMDFARIATMDVPYSKKDRQSVMGWLNYFRSFVPNFATLAAELYADKLNTFPEDYASRFRHLVAACAALIELRHFDKSLPCTLFTDASAYATGGVLVQRGRIVALTSATLTPAQRRYSTTDRETLALLNASNAMRVFVQSNKCLTLSTDHRALLNRQDDQLTPRQARWKHRILSFCVTIDYVSGQLNPADFLSRKGAFLGGNGGRGINFNT